MESGRYCFLLSFPLCGLRAVSMVVATTTTGIVVKKHSWRLCDFPQKFDNLSAVVEFMGNSNNVCIPYLSLNKIEFPVQVAWRLRQVSQRTRVSLQVNERCIHRLSLCHSDRFVFGCSGFNRVRIKCFRKRGDLSSKTRPDCFQVAPDKSRVLRTVLVLPKGRRGCLICKKQTQRY